MRKPIVRIAVITSVVLMTAVLAVILDLRNRSRDDTSTPFLQEQGNSDLRGQLTTIGRRQGIEVVRVTFPAGTDAETLQQDKIYLVSVPDDPNVPNIPLDQAMALSAAAVDYFGYKYTSADAALEKEHRNDAEFLSRFPGQFFASAKARTGVSSSTIAAFEERTGTTFDQTATQTGVLLEPDSLYMIIINDSGNVTFDTFRRRADLGIVSAHFDPGAEKRGSNPTLNIIVKNYGQVSGERDIVFAALPADLTFANPQTVCRVYEGDLKCRTGPIAPGQTKAIWVDFHLAGNFIQCSGEVPLNVNLSFFGGRPDQNPGNDSSQATLTAVCPTPGADLDIGVQPPQQQPDQEVVFPVRVRNYGSDAASSVVVSHTLSDGVTFQSAQGADCNVQGNLLQCSLSGELDGVTQYGVGGEKNFSVTLQYPASQICGLSEERRETFSVTNVVGDINPLNDSYTVFFQTACQADFGLVSARFDPVSVPSNTTPPSTTTLSVNVENSGSAADDAYLKIFWSNGNYFSATTLPPYCDTDWDYLKGYYTKCWTGILSPGESKLFSFTYQANPTDNICPADVPLTASLSLDGQGNDQNWNNNTTQANVTWECPQQ